MCGRFSQSKKHKDAVIEVAEVLDGITVDPGFDAGYEAAAGRYNIRPSSQCLIIRSGSGSNIGNMPSLTLSRWGYRPGWMSDDYIRQSKRGPFINARSETVFEARAFADAVRFNRCLVLVDGFYEPKGEAGSKREQYYFDLPNRSLFALAGIEAAYPDGPVAGNSASFAILTCPPNTHVEPIHGRMPVIVPDTQWYLWLNGEERDPARLGGLLQPWSGQALQCRQVSPDINKRDAEGPWCIEPYAPPVAAAPAAVQGSLF